MEHKCCNLSKPSNHYYKSIIKGNPLRRKKMTNNTMSREQFGSELYALLQKKLNRGENHVSNIAINKVVATYIEKGIKQPIAILEHLQETKPAKSIDKLVEHIMNDMKEGTRTDGQARNFNGLEF